MSNDAMSVSVPKSVYSPTANVTASHVVVPLKIHCHKMSISKLSEAVAPKTTFGQGATARQLLSANPGIVTAINGSFFYFEKMVHTYGESPPIGKSIGDGIGVCNIRNYSTFASSAVDGRCGYIVQTKKGEPFRIHVPTTSCPVELALLKSEHKYVLCCAPMLVMEGQKCSVILTPDEHKSDKGPPGHLGHLQCKCNRSMFGTRKNGDVVLACGSNMDLDDMQTNMLSLGCVRAVGLDGGGSSFLWNDGKMLQENTEPDRIVGNAIVVFGD
jgi:hypothetical protein